jgi:hypothetical protein
MLMDWENTLSNGQHPSDLDKFAKTKNIPFQEGIGPPPCTPKLATTFPITINTITPNFHKDPPHFSPDKSRGGGGASWVNPRKHLDIVRR